MGHYKKFLTAAEAQKLSPLAPLLQITSRFGEFHDQGDGKWIVIRVADS
jgi:hypothetical protein